MLWRVKIIQISTLAEHTWKLPEMVPILLCERERASEESICNKLEANLESTLKNRDDKQPWQFKHGHNFLMVKA